MKKIVQTIIATIITSSSWASNYPAHSGSSPNEYDEIEVPSGTFVVNDQDSPDLDRY